LKQTGVEKKLKHCFY